MSGHSKWKTIKHKKGANDARRGKLWSKLARNIIVGAKAGGGDPAMNLTLRYAIDKAKEANMPNDTIDKAIKRGTGELQSAEYVPAVYEGLRRPLHPQAEVEAEEGAAQQPAAPVAEPAGRAAQRRPSRHRSSRYPRAPDAILARWTRRRDRR